MDLVTILKADHRKVDELFSQIEATSERAHKTKEKLFLQLKSELTIHAGAEEQILYPRMQKLPGLRNSAFEANEEHRLVKQLLEEAQLLESGGEQWNAKIKVLKDLVSHHVREEEDQWFKKLKSAVDAQELREMGVAIEAFKGNPNMSPLDKERDNMPALQG